MRCIIGKYLLIAGILQNSGLIVMDRFFGRLPDWVSLFLRILAVALMITGLLLLQK